MRFASILTVSFTVIALPIITSANPNTANTPTPAQLHKTIQHNYSTMDNAMAHLDFNTVASFYDPDYIGIDSHGDYNPGGREEMRDLYKKLADANSYGLKATLKARDTVVSVKVVAGGVVIIDKGEFTGRLVSSNGNVLLYHSLGRSRDYWVRSGSQYLLKQTRTLDGHSSTTMNGEPVQTPQQ
ncbi:hypothetical protein CCAX7_19050 [Capsulimonas corticalis]|uniref:Uncharacterized protein n=1 Tax=Capsulimonas corticalis TaxID=2219043 RepID=A0A402D5C1_9BACT|nr:hypothetical protein [Capsulimonas corticalis]BDI29854.1 hypothetical protein CCAX7_19050 [Capsulimonas corticalis]